MKKLLFIFFIFFIIQPNIICAQNSYILEGSIGKNKTSDDSDVKNNDIFSFRPISSWVGKRFIFIPKLKGTEKYGYQDFEGGSVLGRFLNYDKYVGRIAKVIAVKKRSSLWDVKFKMEDNGHIIKATAYSESISGIAPIADIDNARSKFLGKTLWNKKIKLNTYNENMDKSGSVKIKKYSPLKVVNIVCSWDNSSPVRFLLKTPSDEVGFEDVSMSGTNVSDILRDSYKFENYFFTKDPKKIYHWPNKVWSAIEEGRVFFGMSTKQASMSWGKPEKVNTTIKQNMVHEQWIYTDDNFLYFENGVLTTIQQ
jgi:hypothetical protein